MTHGLRCRCRVQRCASRRWPRAPRQQAAWPGHTPKSCASPHRLSSSRQHGWQRDRHRQRRRLEGQAGRGCRRGQDGACSCWAPSDGRGACADAPRAAARRWWWTSRPPGAGRARCLRPCSRRCPASTPAWCSLRWTWTSARCVAPAARRRGAQLTRATVAGRGGGVRHQRNAHLPGTEPINPNDSRASAAHRPPRRAATAAPGRHRWRAAPGRAAPRVAAAGGPGCRPLAAAAVG